MLITHTVNIHGQRRVYLTAKGSLDCWIEPADDGQAWTFHMAESMIGSALPPDERRDWTAHILLRLATELAVAPEDLAAVPFEAIAVLHTESPFANRRMPVSRRQMPENAFLAASPGITRPRADFTRESYGQHRQRR